MHIERYLAKARQSMRLTSHRSHFSRLAAGLEGQPLGPVLLDPELLGYDRRCLEYAAVRAAHAGVFNAHFVASLPYVLEEQCRLGAALLDHSMWVERSRGRPARYYTLGDGAGVTARALSRASNGRIQTLCCSPTIENLAAFTAKPAPRAQFFHGPFFEVNPSRLAAIGMPDYSEGFDVIIEDTTFQMYGRERAEPLRLAMLNLRPDGIFLLHEKFAHRDEDEFQRRERQKDEGFKSRYFSSEQIAQKREGVLSGMDQQLVTLEEMSSVLRQTFEHAVLIWNSGNFSTIAASNDRAALTNLVSSMIPPALPASFNYHDPPEDLVGNQGSDYRFRSAEPRGVFDDATGVE